MKAVIIDDEEHGILSLKTLLDNFMSEITVASTASNALDGIKIINQSNPDIVFLDVEMTQITGFDLLDLIENKNLQVIFVTAHDKYALKAIKYCAIDFLLKPVNILELKTAIYKAKRQLGVQHNLAIYNANAKENDVAKKRMILPGADGFIVKELKEIIHLESNDNYTWVYTTDKQKTLVCRTLKEFEELLEHSGFIRIHQSHLINENHVQRYIKGTGGYVHMSDGSVLEVSRRKKDEFLEKFMENK
ncbi:MAG: LytTR family DNA-binding domain-containing protein [Cytophagales bacterium]|nr:LytTR family DNA-binding domain-containing protein [Cytophagales bacterium]